MNSALGEQRVNGSWTRHGLARRLQALCRGGKALFVVRSTGGDVLHNTQADVGCALLWAKEHAWDLAPGEPLTVEQRLLFDDPVALYVVEKNADEGVVVYNLRHDD